MTESGLPTTVLTTTFGGSHSSGHSGTRTASASARSTGGAGKVGSGIGKAVGFGALVMNVLGA
jgi:hypothetical protein